MLYLHAGAIEAPLNPDKSGLRKVFVFYALANPAAGSGECARCSIRQRYVTIFFSFCSSRWDISLKPARAIPLLL